MLSNYRVMYLRDRNHQPIGCLAMRVIPHQSLIQYQLSVLNPLDRFNRAVSRQIAIGRLVEKPLAITLPYANPSVPLNTHDISEAVMQAVKDGRGLPTRARKAAALWLRSNVYTTVQDNMLSQHNRVGVEF